MRGQIEILLKDVFVHKKNIQRRITPRNLARDLLDLTRGVLDVKSLYWAYMPVLDPITVEVRDKNGKLKSRRYSHNLRTTVGIDHLCYLLAGGTTYQHIGTFTSAPTSTGASDTNAAFPVTNAKLNGCRIISGGVFGRITNCTATTVVVDQWTPLQSPTGAAGVTPSNGASYYISDAMTPAYFLAVSNDGTAPAITDTTVAGEIVANGLSRVVATVAHTYGASSLTYTVTFTCATAPQSHQKAGILTALSSGVLVLEGTYTQVALQVGDQSTITWTVGIS